MNVLDNHPQRRKKPLKKFNKEVCDKNHVFRAIQCASGRGGQKWGKLHQRFPSWGATPSWGVEINFSEWLLLPRNTSYEPGGDAYMLHPRKTSFGPYSVQVILWRDWKGTSAASFPHRSAVSFLWKHPDSYCSTLMRLQYFSESVTVIILKILGTNISYSPSSMWQIFSDIWMTSTCPCLLII